ncbi:MAG TPA: GTP-binding protein [Tepidisphaeraceae bacterium]|nr:GTP-binding protein [Tepidisphaeraceae bacterium]
MARSRYIMIGGFLGAGKTTAVLRLAEHLTARGLKVGLITNDQSVGLVDTAMLASHGFAVEEITGGCFCCKFNSLVDAAGKLSAQTRPDVFIAEPVGSCTDLKASVSYPLRRIYGDDFSVAPLSVLIDPVRALRILGVEPGKAFSPKVVYVYTKQLEEAEIIVINKIDLLSEDRRAALRAVLSERFPTSRLLEVSARQGAGLEEWFDAIGDNDLGTAPTMDVDYELYAQGEALLGWLNCTLNVSAAQPLDGNALLQDLAQRIRGQLESSGAQIAHLKMTLTPGESARDIAVLNVVADDQAAELSHTLDAPIETGELIVNLRAQADPELLADAVNAAFAGCAGATRDLSLNVEHLERFRPGKPEPTYRYANA